MADINKMRPGGTEPDRVLFAKPPKKLKFMFTEWVLNTAAGHDVDVTYDKVVIRKFKPNVWIMHNPSLLNSADSSREVCNYARGTMVSVRGMTAHADIFNAYKTLWSSTGAGGDLPKMRGFCMYPYTHDCEIWWCTRPTGMADGATRKARAGIICHISRR